MTSEVKRCPFCGGEAHRVQKYGDERNGYANTVYYECGTCFVRRGATGKTRKSHYADNSNIEADALAAWNQRARS